ncbi:hypothetical protein BT63DRAFT_409989 [Microthyrium microscopicum]|uniref:BZIP domain-containing protein n=1 Tax=Microthyrium microscopicum TaxID=703497 RepID=A0A6A6UL18_9PEZI|nr:hypothetical protein BT63DRAFT_409989 [Microthyrium microscopicum]
MAACVPKHTENPLPAFQGDRMEHYVASTTYESASDSTDFVFLDPNQYFQSELFSLGMMPTADALEAYCDYGDLVEYSFEPYIATASAPITEGHLNHSMSPLERTQPNAGLSLSTNKEILPRENPTVTVQQVASDKRGNTPTKKEQRNLARQRRRLRNRVTAAESRERKKAELEELQQRVEALLKRESELERQVQVFQQDIKVLSLQNEVITQENARLCLEMDRAA